MAEGTSEGLAIKSDVLDAKMSEGSVDRVAETWLATLDWAERNPLLWVSLLILVVIWLFLNYLRSRDSKEFSLEYKERRDKARAEAREPPLPLPAPNAKEDGND